VSERGWSDRLLSPAVWSLNVGLAAMVFMFERGEANDC